MVQNKDEFYNVFKVMFDQEIKRQDVYRQQGYNEINKNAKHFFSSWLD